ncbi:MAG TPA: glycosyltransferase family A protein [Puia sp.]|nr:glycosyltransferase family A protein [Puia sp.]
MAPHRISFCTVAMNRTPHLRETIAKNIRDNLDFGRLEFILLDYNSSDGCEFFVKKELGEFIEKGILNYYKTTEPRFFHHSHSRNMAFRLATGDLICNVDADNFTGFGFAYYLDKVFSENEGIFLATGRSCSDLFGRVTMRASDFYNIRGYDERMTGYGFEDLDLINRLSSSGLKRINIADQSYLGVIRHGNWERICNKPESMFLDSILVKQIDFYSSLLIFLMKNGDLYSGTVLDNSCRHAADPFAELESIDFPYEYSLLEESWTTGHWDRDEDGIRLFYGGQTKSLRGGISSYYLRDDSSTFFIVESGTDMAEEGLFFQSQLFNRAIMRLNSAKKTEKVNASGFGQGIVSRNFDDGHFINLHYGNGIQMATQFNLL